jgi:hypothetical protein
MRHYIGNFLLILTFVFATILPTHAAVDHDLFKVQQYSVYKEYVVFCRSITHANTTTVLVSDKEDIVKEFATDARLSSACLQLKAAGQSKDILRQQARARISGF